MNPKVLIFDIETAPMLAYVWARRDQNIGVNQIKSDWYVIAWAAKWLGDPPSKVIYFDQEKARNIEDDKRILLPLWKLLDEADIVITQNGKNFDSKKINARFILNGINPPSPYKHWDTYQVVRRVADFTSNSLEYLTEKLCIRYKKQLHKDFPGMELWKQCLAGNPAAWREMRRYNIHDVLSTEELYTKIRAWAPDTAPAIHAVTASWAACRTCGQTKVVKNGVHRKSVGLYQRLHCMGCGKWTLGEKIK
jgi:DNA polymerase elongation subunit (family B)